MRIDDRHVPGIGAAAGAALGAGIINVLDADAAGTIILGITAGVAAAYAYLTWRMAEATNRSAAAAQRSADVAEQHLGAVAGSSIAAWLPIYVDSSNGCICRVLNYGMATALNVRLLPLWGDAIDGEPNLELVEIDKDEANTMEYPNGTSPRRQAVAQPGQFGDVALPQPPPEDGGVMCVRWDDPLTERRKWRCWKLPARGSRHGREPIEEAQAGWRCDDCPEKSDEGVCPHGLGEAYARKMFGA